ncbi:MAG: SpoIID/LytB domain-containing protein [Scytolyngbya sp. HA4215-MV1]|jgi:peptidoglycan hydrolase-like amidase|nr:SpoIID/LytB domain-containing protein [Scytolyngbya sp. HA4215-MV1]
MTTPPPSHWLKRLLLWIVLPGLGVLSLLGLALSRQKLASVPLSEPPTPTSSSSPNPALPRSPGIAAAPTPIATAQKKPPARPSPQPVNPNHLTAQQKNINRESKAQLLNGSHSVDALVEMRVAIASGASSLTLGATTPTQVQDKNGRSLQVLAEGATYTIQATGDTIQIGDVQASGMVWVLPPPGRLFRLGDRTYRGQLLLAAEGGRLWAVNYINLRQYLHSVVASEVSSSWPMAALKAQAIAARSYALTYYFKPVNGLYHIGSDEYYQVYSGIDREADSVRQAVDQTAGEFVSYRGGVVESLYAASDDIVAEAFQGKGMSQLGALGLAEQGYTYHQILSNYYPGTGVARIEEDIE